MTGSMRMITLMALSAGLAGASAQETDRDAMPDGIPDAVAPVAGQTTISDLLARGFEILDYEMGTIRINRFQIVERVLLRKDAKVYTCTFRIERDEAADAPKKVSICVPVE